MFVKIESSSTVISFENHHINVNGTPCNVCKTDTRNIPKKKIGVVTIGWCLCLIGTGIGWLHAALIAVKIPR